MKDKVTFTAKAWYQKDDCFFCEAEATLQANYGNASIRCCDNKECKAEAKKLAIDTGSIK